VPDRPLVIVGAATFAVEVLEAAELSGREVRGFLVSDTAWRTSPTHEGLPVFTPDEIADQRDDLELVSGIVSTKRRGLVDDMTRRGFTFGVVRHPSAIVSPRATVAPGVFIGAGVIVSARTVVGPHVILNRGANLAHDVDLGPFATVGPGAVIAGAVTVGARAWIGVGAVVRDHLTIGDGAVVAAGAVVVKPVPAGTLVAGCPATVVREGMDGF
jgi:sugar O-acyltransferase (sialic acid O-acetyltransferase NeuD family)